MAELKPCPFCGSEDLDYGEIDQPDAWWDSGMRGEKYGYVMCIGCGCILKADNLNDATIFWNRRQEE